MSQRFFPMDIDRDVDAFTGDDLLEAESGRFAADSDLTVLPDRLPKAKKLPKQPDGEVDPSSGPSIDGVVTEGARGQYWVETPGGSVLCQVRGKLRKNLLYAASSVLPGTTLRHKVRRANLKARDPVTVGQRVRITLMAPGRGLILEVLPDATGSFTRDDPFAGTTRSVSGIDQLIVVFAARDPEPHLRLLDRMLVLAEAQELSAVICLNKIDLGPSHGLVDRLGYYRNLGYHTVFVSAAAGLGVDELRLLLVGHTSALLGPSGVGKSSLLNAVEPELGLRVSSISQATHKGRHTTSGTRVVPLAGGGFVADTAGIRSLGLGRAAAGKLDWCFREFRPYLGACPHRDCGHVNEPECPIRAAGESGDLDMSRYESYRRLYEQGAATGGRIWRDLVSSRSVVGDGDFRL